MNYEQNQEIRKRYSTIDEFISRLQLPNKIFANLDLATGTGKSYVIYGIAQIMLGIGIVDRVLVLCPSLTIESALKDKFLQLSSDANIKETIPENAFIANPRIIDANVTILEGDICVENIHAVYENTGSSIFDSFKTNGCRTLVMNDESHHIFNDLQSVSGSTTEGKNIKKWKEFLLNEEINFKYILGFTGTAYIDNEYFNDVIYRYSLRKAVEDGIVKNIDYVQKDDNSSDYEKFQKIFQNHKMQERLYPLVKPLTILITKDINSAKGLYQKCLEFLVEYTNESVETVKKKLLVITSNNEHKANLQILKYVDNKDNLVEWIISVSMLTEGWDVKNVFQIVPWQDRAFNSKLLIAQVLGRGLRLPDQYKTPQPKVIVFNHDSWSKNIKGIVDAVLEIETKIKSSILKSGDREKFNFSIYNLDNYKKETEIEHDEEGKIYDYSKSWEEGIALDSQIEKSNKDIIYESIVDYGQSTRNYNVSYRTKSIDEIVDKITYEFKIRDTESKIFGLGNDEVYSKEKLPPREKIYQIIRNSMNKVGITGDRLTEKNAQKVLNSFSTLLRKKQKTVIQQLIYSEPYIVETKDIHDEKIGISSFRRDYTLFYSSDYVKDILDIEQMEILKAFLEDGKFPRDASKEKNPYVLKTALNIFFTNGEPERLFVDKLCMNDNAGVITAWIKSRDIGFYSIEYSIRINGHSKQGSFNPDFFIKVCKGEQIYILVVEIKADKDISRENKAKYKYAIEHFTMLNAKMREMGKNETYLFHFLSPSGYDTFFEYLQDGRLFKNQTIFRCELENSLESAEE